MKLLKDKKHNTVLFVALEPDSKDRNWDVISKEEIMLTAHEFILNLKDKKFNFDHESFTDTEKAKVVESYVLPNEYAWYKEGSWILWVKFSPDLYKNVISWDVVGISIEWKGERGKF